MSVVDDTDDTSPTQANPNTTNPTQPHPDTETPTQPHPNTETPTMLHPCFADLLERVANIQLPPADLQPLRGQERGGGEGGGRRGGGGGGGGVIKHRSGQYGSYEDLVVLFLRTSSRMEVLGSLLTHISNTGTLRTESGKTLLHIAAKENPKAIFRLVQTGCDVMAKDSVFLNSPLHVACCYGNLDAIFFLIQCGGHVNAENGAGETPLDVFLSICRTPIRSSIERSRLLIAHTLTRIGFKVNPKGHGDRKRQGWRDKMEFALTKVKRCNACHTLQHLCRLRVRSMVPPSHSIHETVRCLELAATLQEYLLYRPCVLDRHVICPHIAKELLFFQMEED